MTWKCVLTYKNIFAMYAQVHMCVCETEYSPKSFCYDVLIFNFTTSPQNSIDNENVLLL